MLQLVTYTHVFAPERQVVWNVSLAITLLEHERYCLVTVPVAEDVMRHVATVNAWTRERAAQVDVSVPGIGAPVIIDGAIGYQLIDGTHRCARALADKRPFFARLLTDEAARMCIIPELTTGWEYLPWQR